MKIRRARISDAFRVRRAYNNWVEDPSAMGHLSQLLLMLSCSMLVSNLLRRVALRASFRILIVEHEGGFAGFGYLRGAAFKDRFWLGWYLESEYREKGFGAILLGAIIAECKHMGGKRLYVTTFVDNIPAIKSYEKYNFKPITMTAGLNLDKLDLEE